MKKMKKNLTIEFNHTGIVQVRGDIEDAPFLNRIAPAISALDKVITALEYKPSPAEERRAQSGPPGVLKDC